MATARGSSRETEFNAKFESLKREIIETFDMLFQALEKRKSELLSRLSSIKAAYDRNVELEEAIKQLKLAEGNAASVMTSNLLGESVLDDIQAGVYAQIQQQQAMKESVQDLDLVIFRSFSERILKSIKETDLIELIPEYVGRESPILKKSAWGTGNGQIQNGMGIAVDNTTNEVYIVDMSNDRIQVFSTDGAFIRSFGHRLLVRGYGICLSDDDVYVTDKLNLLIKFDKTGNFLKNAGTHGNAPGCFDTITGLCYDNGLLYVCELILQRIQIFDSELNFFLHFGSGVVKFPIDIKIHSNTIYILSQDHSAIYCYSRCLQHTKTIHLEPKVFYQFLAIDSKGNFITSTDSSSILIFSPDGVLKHRLGEEHLRNLSGIALDETNHIFCVNAGLRNYDCFQKY